jgi:hypothetical protein
MDVAQLRDGDLPRAKRRRSPKQNEYEKNGWGKQAWKEISQFGAIAEIWLHTL